jgi:IS30 family transposase
VRGTELVAEERESISRGIAAGDSFRAIGKLLNRDHSVVSREVERNGGRSAYRVIPAQRRADEQRARPKLRLWGSRIRSPALISSFMLLVRTR